jgi:hypothetical protein
MCVLLLALEPLAGLASRNVPVTSAKELASWDRAPLVEYLGLPWREWLASDRDGLITQGLQ